MTGPAGGGAAGSGAAGDPDALLRARGTVRDAGGFVVGCAASRDGTRVAFATAEGALHLAPLAAPGAAWQAVPVHDGAVLSLSAGVAGDGFLTGGDDNTLRACDGEGRVAVLARARRWVEHVASFAAAPRGGGGLVACASGRQVELRSADNRLLRTLEHPGTVSGIAFDARGKRIAASHYNGVSLWFTGSAAGAPRLLEWKGSHIGVALHPEGEAVVTAMQENELHGWRLADGHTMRMSGYPQKTQSLGFSRTGRWLATAGAEAVVLWPFFGGGPMGKPPTELAAVPGSLCTRVAFHPRHDIVTAGYACGTVLMAELGSRRVLPVCGPGGGAVSALAFDGAGAHLAFGTAGGRMALLGVGTQRSNPETN